MWKLRYMLVKGLSSEKFGLLQYHCDYMKAYDFLKAS